MGIKGTHEHASLSDTYMTLAAHKHVEGLDIFWPEMVSFPIPNETKMVLSLDGILQIMMITKGNVKRYTEPSQDEIFCGWRELFSIHVSLCIVTKLRLFLWCLGITFQK